MTKSYLLVFSDKTGTKDEVKLALNKMTKVKTWRTDMPNCFYVISDNSAFPDMLQLFFHMLTLFSHPVSQTLDLIIHF